MSSSQPPSPQEMGDIFNARRAAAAEKRREARPNPASPAPRREQGAVASLLESFGFVRCAERPEEVFFHYSEVAESSSSATLEVGTEVEFEVGASRRSPDRPAAYRVTTLPPGTVVWETREGTRRRCRVERAARDRGEGTLSPEEDGDAAVVRYASGDYAPRGRRDPARLREGDVVECVVATERRTGRRYAREITMVRSEKERAREEREARLLAAATPDRGVATSVGRDGGGWIRATKFGEPVRFTAKHARGTLREGRCVELLVCREEESDEPPPSSRRRGDHRPRPGGLTARRVVPLPESETVEFHEVVARRAEGVLVVAPRPAPRSRDKDRPPGAGGTPGRIRLTTPLADDHDATEVLLHADDVPGGVREDEDDRPRHGRGGKDKESSSSSWVREGDVLRFDVVRESHDGSYRAVGTTDDGTEDAPAVRLVELALAGRAEGVVSAVKEGGFGFVALAERQADAYFRLDDVVPGGLLSGDDGATPELKVGDPVSFDLSVAPGGGGGGGGHHRKENLRAARLVPTKAVVSDLPLAANVRAVVAREHSNGSFTLELETAVPTATPEARRPLVARLLDSVDDVVTFSHAQSHHEAKAIVSMAEARGLEVSMVGGNGSESTVPAENGHARLRLRRPRPGETVPPSPATTTTDEDGATAEAAASSPKPPKPRTVRSVRLDKSAAPSGGPPLGVGDTVLCAVVQSRRTGVCAAVDATVVERAAPAVGEGVVAEIVSGRGFGFVARLPEGGGGGKREKLFFHVSHVVPSTTTEDQDAPAISKGDEVRFEVGAHEKTGRPVALRVTVLPKGTLDLSGLRSNKQTPPPPACRGIVLMEPSHTVLSNTPTHATTTRRPVDAVVGSPGGGRWDKVDADLHRHKKQPPLHGTNMKEEGVLLLVSDPHGLFAKETQRDRSASVGGDDDGGNVSPSLHVRYREVHVAPCRPGETPRRGDLVSFVRGKGGVAKDVRSAKPRDAVVVRGVLRDLDRVAGTAALVVSGGGEVLALPDLRTELVSCDVAALEEGAVVEGVRIGDGVHGLCRATDLYLETKLRSGRNERKRLNLTVRKELQGLGGKIVAQSGLAKGPDGTIGFVTGWTNRKSRFAVEEEQEAEERDVEVEPNVDQVDNSDDAVGAEGTDAVEKVEPSDDAVIEAEGTEKGKPDVHAVEPSDEVVAGNTE